MRATSLLTQFGRGRLQVVEKITLHNDGDIAIAPPVIDFDMKRRDLGLEAGLPFARLTAGLQ